LRLASRARLAGIGVDTEDGAHVGCPFCCSSIADGGPASQTTALLHR
jgi:hypothetical protein